MTEKKKSTKKEVAETDEGPVKQVKKVKAKELIADEEIEALVSESIDASVAEAEEAVTEEVVAEIATAEAYGFEPEVKRE